MKVLVLALLVACASAQWFPAYGGYYNYNRSGYFSYPYAVAPAPLASQYHAQDALGQVSYGYSHPGQAATNYQDAAGNQIGSYAYINPEGKEVRVSYVADQNGFRVLSNDLPVAPVSDLKAPVFDGKAPEPVQDTPEVVAAKAQFSKLYNEAAAAAAAAADEPATSDATSADAPAADAPAADATPVKVEVARKKRQVFSVLPSKQFVDDLHYKSVDLNQDGQPDVPVYPVAPTFSYVAPAVKYVAPAVSYVAPTVKFVAPAPFVATPVFAKSTLKTYTAEADPSAKTPSATTKFDVKEKSVDVVTPLGYSAPFYPYAYPFVQTVAAASAESTPVKVESSRKKRQVFSVLPTKQFVDDLHYKSVDLNQDGQPDVPVYPVAPAVSYVAPTIRYVAPAPFVAPVPLVTKTTFKTVSAEVDPSAKTPADTNKFDLKEKSFDVVTPFAYHTPYAYSYPFVPTVAAAPVAAAAPVKVESSRKKRQIAVVPNGQFYRDFAYNSVDLNQDGQPDKAVTVTSPLAYSAYYPYSYPFYNRFYGF